MTELETFGQDMLDREQDLEVYIMCDAHLHGQVLALLVGWVHICLINWFDHQWRSTSEMPFPDLFLLW